MPNRIIKETICSSENIDELSAFHETVFYRLIVNCDDFGRMDARPKILASRLFPLKEIRAKQMEDALRALTSADLVTVYYVAGKPILQMKTWDRHQNVRAKKSKYPGPEEADEPNDNVNATDINCMQMYADVPVIQSNTKSISISESESDARVRAGRAAEEQFALFWEAYPKKVGKQAALKAFAKVSVETETLIRALEKQKKSDQWTRDGGRYIPNATTWLNQGRWEDELPGGKSKNDQYVQHGELSPMMAEAVRKMMEEESSA